MNQPFSQNPTLLPGPTGVLETVVLKPEIESPSPRLHIICHPHPLFGGTMHNKVITALAKTFHEAGDYSIRFNYRGVGKSEGIYDEAKGEVDDLLAIIAWGQLQFPELPIYLSGFSFGAYIALKGALHSTHGPNIQKLLTVAPAIQHVYFPKAFSLNCPWVLIMGEKDELVPLDLVKRWVDQQSNPLNAIYLPDTGHFFHSKLILLKETVKDHFL